MGVTEELNVIIIAIMEREKFNINKPPEKAPEFLLSRNKKEEIVRLSRLGSVLKEAYRDENVKGYTSYFGDNLFNITLQYAETEADYICYFPKLGFVSGYRGAWSPMTYEETIDLLNKRGRDTKTVADKFFDSFYQLPESVGNWKKELKSKYDQPVEEKDLSEVKNIIEENYAFTANAWLEKANIYASNSRNYRIELDKAKEYAKKAGISLDKEKVKEIVKAYYQNLAKRCKKNIESEKKKNETISPEWVIKGYTAEKIIGKKGSDFKPYAEEILPNIMRNIKSEMLSMEKQERSWESKDLSLRRIKFQLGLAKKSLIIAETENHEVVSLEKEYKKYRELYKIYPD